MEELLQSSRLARYPKLTEYSDDLATSFLEEAARFAEEVLEPLNRSGDAHGARWTAEGVVSPPGFKQAYEQFAAGAWPALAGPSEYGGQCVPKVLETAVQEIWASANLSFGLFPMLTSGAVHALTLCGTPEQKQHYLPKMISGEWAGTMVLTEPQAGSDLSLVRTRAVPEGDHYRIRGQKIFITWGEQDLTGNIIHMVLARIEGAPPGVKGISLFLVPKFLPGEDGSAVHRNDVRCLSIEHKLGIHASPTCVLAFGEREGAIGYLIGAPHHGLEYMFIMMNAARLSVGVQGYAVGERASQQAVEWARSRMQGKPAGLHTDGAAPIIHHPDVKRMLLFMRACNEASRALALYTSLQIDIADNSPDAAERMAAQERADLLVPIVKGWCTERGNEVAALGIQIHGGMGFIEETGAAQYVRDVRITTIYEGTTGIQSNDLLGRKLARDRGACMNALLEEMTRELSELAAADPGMSATARSALEAVSSLREATRSLLTQTAAHPEAGLAVSVPYLELCGYVIGGWLMARAGALAGSRGGGADHDFYRAKVQTTRFYAEQVLPRSLAQGRIVTGGAASVAESDVNLL
jgi:alkylation response protein AidB-like acyl-CoA dehydrogenase